MIEKLLEDLFLKARRLLLERRTLMDINATFDQKATVLRDLLRQYYQEARSKPDPRAMKLLDQIGLLDDYLAVSRTFKLLQQRWKDLD
jgi:hypothetical protein